MALKNLVGEPSVLKPIQLSTYIKHRYSLK